MITSMFVRMPVLRFLIRSNIQNFHVLMIIRQLNTILQLNQVHIKAVAPFKFNNRSAKI